MGPGGRSRQISRFWRFWAGLVIYITQQVRQSTVMNQIATLVCISTRFLALGPRLGLVVIAQGRLFWLPGVAIWADFEIFQILRGADDRNKSTSMPNYCDEPNRDLGTYINKVRSAWTEVSIAT